MLVCFCFVFLKQVDREQSGGANAGAAKQRLETQIVLAGRQLVDPGGVGRERAVKDRVDDDATRADQRARRRRRKRQRATCERVHSDHARHIHRHCQHIFFIYLLLLKKNQKQQTNYVQGTLSSLIK
jgi:hypothetical protein